MPTSQETFNLVYTHLLKQNAKSQALLPATRFDSTKLTLQCAYRGENGLKCAAGAAIPDEEYTPSMEGEAANTGLVKDVMEKNGYDLAFMGRLQSIHDRFDPCDWRYQLGNLARIFGLTIPEQP